MPSLFEEFPPVTTAEWEAAIRKDLKGADYQRLLWHTDDGIEVRPYYRREDLEHIGPLNEARTGGKTTNDWLIREVIDAADLAQANTAAQAALAGGAGEICFTHAAPHTLDELKLLLDGLDEKPVHFWADATPTELLMDSGLSLKGGMKLHPLADAELAAAFLKRSPGPAFRPVAIRTTGATSVQEVAFVLASGIDYLKAMRARGVSLDQASYGVTFCFPIGSSYFFQIAKFRAFRMLWARAVEDLKGSKEAAKAYIFARTTAWNKSVYDAYNNVLRGTTEAMSAAIAGVDSLAVSPFDEVYRTPDAAARRLARNTQTILKHEARLDRAADPGGGSYYIEVLTHSIAEAASKLMQEMDSAALSQAMVQTRQRQEEAVAFRRRVIVGANNYPNLQERMLDRIQCFSPDRGAALFEQIRLRTERHVASGNKAPLLLIADTGDRTRVAFILNFFGCAGFEMRVEHFENDSAIAARAAELGADAVILPSSADALANTNAVETLTAWQHRLGVADAS
jgi:methylmalonyl-CoA mutase